MNILAVSTQYRHVTDRQTDQHLATAFSVLCITSRGKHFLRDTNMGDFTFSKC